MGRRRIFTDEQIATIRDDPRQYKDIAKEYNTTILTIGKVKRREGAYRDLPHTLGTPILDANGITLNIIPNPEDEEEMLVPFRPPVRHE